MAGDPRDGIDQYKPNMRGVTAAEIMRPNRRTNGAGVQAEETRICVVMVGLPARGKSLIASKGTSILQGMLFHN